MPPRITGLVNQKGGVTKTTTAMNLGAVTHEALGGTPHHSPVLVVSTDPQNSSKWWLDLLAEVPFDHQSIDDPADLVRLAADQHRQILIDTPGNLDGPILRGVLDIVDDVLVPLIPEAMAFDPTARTIEQVLVPRCIPYRVFISRWDPRTRNSRVPEDRSDLEQCRAYVRARGWNLAASDIRSYRVVSQLPNEGKVITQYPESNRTATQSRNDYLRLALEVGLGQPLTGAVPAIVRGVDGPVALEKRGA